MVDLDEEPCLQCGEIAPINERYCPSCGEGIWFPNVKLASLDSEVSELERRYKEAKESALNRVGEKIVTSFERVVVDSFAVINMPPSITVQLLEVDKALYGAYAKQAQASLRLLAAPEDDQTRKTVESKLYGTASEEVKYAALSLDGWGLDSYGSLAVKLKSDLICHRSAVLESNSYKFMKDHEVQVVGEKPKGCLAIWENRGKLALIKLQSHLKSSSTTEDFYRLILISTEDRKKDVFLEVHIYGPIFRTAFEEIKVKIKKKPLNKVEKREKRQMKDAKEFAKVRGVRWVEE